MTLHTALAIWLLLFMLACIGLACWGIAMLVADWRAERRHRRSAKRRITAIINLARF